MVIFKDWYYGCLLFHGKSDEIVILVGPPTDVDSLVTLFDSILLPLIDKLSFRRIITTRRGPIYIFSFFWGGGWGEWSAVKKIK